MQALSYENQNFISPEPFQGLFTQGMVCHETYKDDNNKWVSPDEVFTENGKDYFKIKDKKKIIVGPSESMSKSKKNTIDPEKIMDQFGADAVIISLGVDTFERDPISFFKLTSPDFIKMGASIASLGLPTLFVMEGGYAVEEIGINTVNVLMGFKEKET